MSNELLLACFIVFVLALVITARVSQTHLVWSTNVAWKIARRAKAERDAALHKAREHLVSRIDSGESVEQATRVFKEDVKLAHHDYELTVARARELGKRLNGDHSEEE